MPTITEDQIVWIFGSPRTGSTWLTKMLVDLTGGTRVDEPMIGAHLGFQAEQIMDQLADRPSYFFSRATEDTWRPPLRTLLLERLGLGAGHRPVIVKEPNGSLAAPLLVRTLPGSKVIVLVRDGRDVVDSLLDAVSEGWLARWVGSSQEDRAKLVQRQSRMWVDATAAALRTIEILPEDQTVLVTYEELLADTPHHLARIAGHLGLEGDVAAVVARHAFSAVPDSEKGQGMFHRSATPGLWREHFDADEVAVMTRIMGPMLERLGYGA